MSARLEGRVAVVTGAASGIGRACALRFAAEGAAVVVADLHEAPGSEVVRAIESEGGRAVWERCDVAREADCEALAERAVAEFGRLDVLVAAAGIGSGSLPGGGERPPLRERVVVQRPLEGWERVLRVNLTGAMLANRACARRMVAGGRGGAIVNVASTESFEPMVGGADYCVSKTGVVMLTKVLALELAQHGVRVNALAPGAVDTPMLQRALRDAMVRRALEELTPIGRVATPDEVAASALFLASDEASFITGAVLHVDGGRFTE